ncbi:phage portal protein [Ancylobacter amanitiformis]|uniref:Lambda family phage portal protein n=1 Tax=Ancylobacter amanitiformis TaxID=217069 RepID=A0ABU0LQA3_9HYPH|nr:phage portal protein [Ancylobacter amanitiformis]MDQ0510890.1 lambda family phage portal protein [Ancylobacter amanitiformis]
MAYFRNNASPFFRSWMPALRETAQDIRGAWQQAAARTIDAYQNSGFISGIVDQSASAVVGTGLSLSCQPDVDALDWTEDQGAAWARMVERRFYSWSTTARECDAGGRMTFGQMQDAAYKGWFWYGEILALLPIFQRRRGGSYSKVTLLPASRLSRKSDGQRQFDGVTVDALGCPFSYTIQVLDRWGMRVDREYSAFDRDGRQRVIHVFEPGLQTYRGISPLAPVLKVVRQIDQFSDATLTKALIQTIFAATIKSDLTGIRAFQGLMTGDDGIELNLAGYADARSQWYESEKIDLNKSGRIGHLFPNEELQFHESTSASAAYDEFMGWLLRELCLVAGVTYTAGTLDSRKATYSSVRMDTAVNWNVVLRRRAFIVKPFCQSVYEAWLEDEIGSGSLPFPGGLDAFLENKAAACGSQWNGPAQPQADELKAARAYETYKNMGVMSLARISEALGIDPDDELRQRKREKDAAIKLGLPDPHTPQNPGAEFSRAEQGSDEDKTDNPSFVPD